MGPWLCFSCLVLLYSSALPSARTRSNSCVFLRLFFFPPLKVKKYGQFSRFFNVWDLIYTLYHSEHKKHSRIGLFSVFYLRLFSSPSLLSSKNTPGFFRLLTCSLTPTQTWKMRLNWPHYPCLCSALFPLKNHSQAAFFRGRGVCSWEYLVYTMPSLFTQSEKTEPILTLHTLLDEVQPGCCVW